MRKMNAFIHIHTIFETLREAANPEEHFEQLEREHKTPKGKNHILLVKALVTDVFPHEAVSLYSTSPADDQKVTKMSAEQRDEMVKEYRKVLPYTGNAPDVNGQAYLFPCAHTRARAACLRCRSRCP